MVPNHFRPDRRLVTISIELRQIQAKIPYNFSLHSNSQNAVKQSVVLYLSQLHIISSSCTIYCIHGIFLIVQTI